MTEKKRTKVLSWVLSPTLMLTLVPMFRVPAMATSDSSTYTVTIPSELSISKSGWTADAFAITASGSLAEGKMLTVTGRVPDKQLLVEVRRQLDSLSFCSNACAKNSSNLMGLSERRVGGTRR